MLMESFYAILLCQIFWMYSCTISLIFSGAFDIYGIILVINESLRVADICCLFIYLRKKWVPPMCQMLDLYWQINWQRCCLPESYLLSEVERKYTVEIKNKWISQGKNANASVLKKYRVMYRRGQLEQKGGNWSSDWSRPSEKGIETEILWQQRR